MGRGGFLSRLFDALGEQVADEAAERVGELTREAMRRAGQKAEQAVQAGAEAFNEWQERDRTAETEGGADSKRGAKEAPRASRRGPAESTSVGSDRVEGRGRRARRKPPRS